MFVLAFIFSFFAIPSMALPPTIRPDHKPALQLKGEVVKVVTSVEKVITYHNVHLRLEFINSDNKPIILVTGTYGNKEWWLLNTALASSIDKLAQGKVLYTGGSGPADSHTSPTWQSLREQLSQPLPPPGLTHILYPGQKYIYYTNTLIELTDPDRSQIPAIFWLQVSLELWPFNIERKYRENTFGQMLKRKWSKTGSLQLDKITSEPIKLDLSTQ